ncbi:hypothetical protein ACQP1V_12925 [Microtetraspora malaysiensis]|uniref:hypothetical protein n=1 Tax=Microtetraspora malaysiensis TaxID=161358 RepID=UPI003D922BB0
MIDARSVIETMDWAGLHHAYGEASDAPEALLALLSGDPESCGATLGYLDAAVLHQGSLYPVIAPAALFVAGVLGDERTLILCESDLPWDDRERPLRAALLEWLGSVAESAADWDDEEDDEDDEDEGGEGDEDDEARSAAASQAIRRDLYAAVLPFLDDADDAVRRAAVGAMGQLMLAPELAEFRGEQAQWMQRLAHHPTSATAVDRAAAALTLGNWGIAPQAFLADPDPSVRAAAALAPALDPDPRALAEIRRALVDPGAADDWFTEHLPQLDGKLRFGLVKALLRRTRDFEEILPEALAVAQMTSTYTVDADWGPLLKRAFTERHTPGRPLTTAQRRFLSAIVDNDECWSGVANPLLWFRDAGLPHNRESLRTLVSAT